MPAVPKSRQTAIAIHDPLRGWLVLFRVLILRLAQLAMWVFIEPWEAAGNMVKAALVKMDEMSRDEAGLAVEDDPMRRHPHVLNAATNLLGICFIIIGGLKLTNQNSKTYSDEIAWAAAFFLVISIAMSYFGVREGIEREWRVRIADWSFLIGIAALIVSMVIAAYQL
ncbi:MAG TPA: hypothetical protein VLC74_14165 [Rhizomicrobium sp.]|nr:hypothetical protein [Rhizomicrobium sp.]